MNGNHMVTSGPETQLYAPPQAIQPPFHSFQFSQPPPQYLDQSQYGRAPSGPGSPMDLSGNEILGHMSMDPGLASLQRGPPTSVPMDDHSFDQMSHLLPSTGEK